ncbi:response regulator [Paludisphaera sp.]|uniref:ATP-binding response regulator n=1 Tax=Paludisphaera sp. TaxID=2017432 RepID=UPI00301C8733
MVARERLVLIVDDSVEDRAAIRRFLRKDTTASYRFLEEETGAEALAIARSAALDCLLLDYALPDMDGLEFLRDLCSQGDPPFPIVMTTGQGDESVAVRALKQGAQDYLVKGRFDHESLRRTVDSAVAVVADRRAAERQRIRRLERLEREARARADELAEMDGRKNEFLAMLAHELRNPLAPIRTALHLMAMPGLDGATIDRARTVAQRQVTQLARLVDDLLEVSRITSGKIRIDPEDADLAAVVARAVEAVRPAMEERRHELSVSPPPTPTPILADPARLEQALVNLLNNAAKYTQDGGRISLRVDREGGWAAIRVRDTGVGISADMLTRIFDMFTQVDRSLDRSQGGLGIGLTLVRTLVELHGGTVEAASDGPGTGSEFTVRLPLAAAPTESASSAPAPPDSAEEARPLRVLLVEDHPDGAEVLVSLIRLWGHLVVAAADGAEALDVLDEARPDVILMDLGLPGMDGYALARRVRERAQDPKPLLVAVTGYGHEEARRMSREAGFDLHLVKPVDPLELRGVLARAGGPAGA